MKVLDGDGRRRRGRDGEMREPSRFGMGRQDLERFGRKGFASEEVGLRQHFGQEFRFSSSSNGEGDGRSLLVGEGGCYTRRVMMVRFDQVPDSEISRCHETVV